VVEFPICMFHEFLEELAVVVQLVEEQEYMVD
jgi:hypothetical protein